ncbi:tryptophan synthase subunit alpha [Candidatus Desantisbacteria bacterium]|nr:tryptophan synthase subunit alpha [Candidatus Desantisbacteria bacterium]
MNRIDETFIRLREKREIALIPYLMAGYPDLETTGKLVSGFEKAGADIIELGVPFSDPIADGPIIQLASEQALKNGVSLTNVLSLVSNLRQHTNIPLVLMTYYNPVFVYGIEKFVHDATAVGVDGVIVPDLPPEEAFLLEKAACEAGLSCIFLLTPTSPPERMRLISHHSTGFIYYVSVTGITGVREMVTEGIGEYIRQLRLVTQKPIGVGFGISSPEHVAQISLVADAAIVGSAIVSLITNHLGKHNLVEETSRFVSELKKATY